PLALPLFRQVQFLCQLPQPGLRVDKFFSPFMNLARQLNSKQPPLLLGPLQMRDILKFQNSFPLRPLLDHRPATALDGIQTAVFMDKHILMSLNALMGDKTFVERAPAEGKKCAIGTGVMDDIM